jgi:hypothetical protein
MTTDDCLLEIARRNWLILAGLVLLSFLARSSAFTLGVAGGGLLAIGSYYWLYVALSGLLRPSGGKSRGGFIFTYLAKLLVLMAALYMLLVPVQAHPVGLAVGVSVVVLNLILTSVTRMFSRRNWS